MHRNRKLGFVIIGFVLILFFLISFTWNDYLSYTMPRHQNIQLPAMFILGVIFAFAFPKWVIKDIGVGISGLIFILASFIFWMLPHSVDKTIISVNFNRLMHLNLFFAGWLLVVIYRGIIFEIKIAFLGMLAAKLAAIGIVMRVFDILLCSSFDIRQQRATGKYYIIIGIVVFIATIVSFFMMPSIENKNKKPRSL